MILTACDERLLPEASSLIKSCARHAPDQGFYLFLVNGTSTTDDSIKRWHPRISIERVTWPLDTGRWRAIMCCARSFPLVSVLERFQEPVLYLDSDTLVRGPLNELWEAIETCDLMVKHRPSLKHTGAAGSPYASRFNNGVIVIKPSEAGRRFARAYDDRLRSYIESGKPLALHNPELGLEFIVDQELLFLTYLDHRDGLSFMDLPEKFNDATFQEGSIIWHGKGTARRHPLYGLERTRYKYAYLFHPLTPLSKSLLRFRSIKGLS